MGGSRRRLKKGKAKVRVGVVKKNKTLKAALPKELADPTRRAQTAAALASLGVAAAGASASALWREQAPVSHNYAAVELVADVNEAFGRNRRNRARPAGADADAPALRTPEARRAAGERTHEDDDELRAALRLPRRSGKNAPQRLTSTAEAVVTSLLAAHGRPMMQEEGEEEGGGGGGEGEGGEGGGGGNKQRRCSWSTWVKDTKRNRMQHSAGKLRAMLEAYDYYGGGAGGEDGSSGGKKHRFQPPKKPYKRL
jgi:nucleolar protein 16